MAVAPYDDALISRESKMRNVARDELFAVLAQNLGVLQNWPQEEPNPDTLRCQDSRHRTLAHLRACQEQWLIAATAFAKQDAPSVKLLHPWRQFAAHHYELVPWAEHLSKLAEDRDVWIEVLTSASWDRGGKWNGKPDTIGGLAKRLAEHETYHIRLVA